MERGGRQRESWYLCSEKSLIERFPVTGALLISTGLHMPTALANAVQRTQKKQLSQSIPVSAIPRI